MEEENVNMHLLTVVGFKHCVYVSLAEHMEVMATVCLFVENTFTSALKIHSWLLSSSLLDCICSIYKMFSMHIIFIIINVNKISINTKTIN